VAHLWARRADNNGMGRNSQIEMHGGTKSTMLKLSIAGLTGLFLTASCVHSNLERTGRMRLGNGTEGRAPIMAEVPAGFEEVGVLTIQADGIATAERLNKHLLRRANLIGCDGLTDVQVAADQSGAAVCLKRREPIAKAEPKAVRVLEPPQELMERASAAGDEGAMLSQVLAQVQARPAAEREWPLRWYLETYPSSPFAPDVSALFEEVTPMRASPSAASVRGAPTP
jgi:hypothetical protein